MSTKTLTFVKDDESTPEPVQAAGSLGFVSVFKPEYHRRMLRLKEGINNLRFLPRLPNSVFPSWLAAPIHFYWSINGVDILAPSTFSKGGRINDAVVEARIWLYGNRRDLMYSAGKNGSVKNENGLRLSEKTNCVAWCVDRNGEANERLRLFWQSFSNGQTGGKVGLGFTLHKEAFRKNLDASSPNFNKPVYGSIADPTQGRTVIIEGNRPSGTKYANYDLQISQEISSIDPYLQALSPEEINLLVALEDVFLTVSHAETIRLLGGQVPSDCMKAIFSEHPFFAEHYRTAYGLPEGSTGQVQPAADATTSPEKEKVTFSMQEDTKPAAAATPAATPAPATPAAKVETPAPAAAKTEAASVVKKTPDLNKSPLAEADETPVTTAVTGTEAAKPAETPSNETVTEYKNSDVLKMTATEEGLNTLMENWSALTPAQKKLVRESQADKS